MTQDIESKLRFADIALSDIIAHFRIKCKTCGHHRIMHDAKGVCEGVMNKPCMSGCDSFIAE